VVNEWNILDEEIISGCPLAGFKRKLDRHLRDNGIGLYISFSFLPLYRQLDDLDSLTHQVQVQVQVLNSTHFLDSVLSRLLVNLMECDMI